jgi:head-tail adaptor
VRAGELNRQITILARQVTKDPVYNTDIIAWVEVKKVWAQVMEMLPSDAEQVSDNVLIATRPLLPIASFSMASKCASLLVLLWLG